MNLGVTGEAAPNAASSSVARYSRAARAASFLSSSDSNPCLALLVGVGGDEARIDREPLGPDQALQPCSAERRSEREAPIDVSRATPVDSLSSGLNFRTGSGIS